MQEITLLSEVHNGLEYRSFDEIPDEVEVTICAESKQLYTSYCGASNKITKTFSYHSAPRNSCPAKKHNKKPCYTTYGTPADETEKSDEENPDSEKTDEENPADSSSPDEAVQSPTVNSAPPVTTPPEAAPQPPAAPSIMVQ